MEARAHLAQGQTRSEKFEAISWLYFLFSYTIYLSLGPFPLNKYFLILFITGFPCGI